MLRKYKLPTSYQLIGNSIREASIEENCKKGHSHLSLREEAAGKLSLHYLNISAYSLRTVHKTWKNFFRPLDIKKATVKTPLVVKRYPLAKSPTAGNVPCATVSPKPPPTSYYNAISPSLQDFPTSNKS